MLSSKPSDSSRALSAAGSSAWHSIVVRRAAAIDSERTSQLRRSQRVRLLQLHRRCSPLAESCAVVPHRRRSVRRALVVSDVLVYIERSRPVKATHVAMAALKSGTLNPTREPSDSLPRRALNPISPAIAVYPSLRSFLHGPLCARRKAGDLGMGLVTGNWISPFASGSGKFGTPFARMHLASAISCRRTLAGTGGECPDRGKSLARVECALRGGRLEVDVAARGRVPARTGIGKFGHHSSACTGRTAPRRRSQR